MLDTEVISDTSGRVACNVRAQAAVAVVLNRLIRGVKRLVRG